ncbi:hypothetical protein K503DRAFT_245503 [Rhizopogon vinicolor AM-OR11-026]|uniref:Uncharacterized protein n=1 Tax=Rhizopogon vinicolor AM-OR11-026 TaxID=1314800 RepID=A0A1B7MXA8_9AGAM|nr:hypothetical protein K503DRAFT_245503 [Rhizopogon vinicolor AM-OR11-026]
MRFHLGETIKVNWQAPVRHSRRDWIGIYRVGANKSTLVTKISSFGMWIPVHDEEWDEDLPLDDISRITTRSKEPELGSVSFEGSALPWTIGIYEVRYHHDGKYNVLNLDGPFEVYVSEPAALDFTSVLECLAHIVPLCLDSDPYLMPLSCGGTQEPADADADGSDGLTRSHQTSQVLGGLRCLAGKQLSIGWPYETAPRMADKTVQGI